MEPTAALVVLLHESFASKNTCVTADVKQRIGLNIADTDQLKIALIGPYAESLRSHRDILSVFLFTACLFVSLSSLSLLAWPCLRPLCSFRLWGCYYGTNTTWSARLPTWPTSPPSQTSGQWRIKCCSSRPSASTARASTASSRWWETETPPEYLVQSWVQFPKTFSIANSQLIDFRVCL